MKSVKNIKISRLESFLAPKSNFGPQHFAREQTKTESKRVTKRVIVIQSVQRTKVGKKDWESARESKTKSVRLHVRNSDILRERV